MDGVFSGHAPTLAAQRGGWFIGHFVDDDDTYRKTDAVELKWGVHKKGEPHDTFAANKTATTISIHIRGKLHLTFRKGGQLEPVLLENEGDFALWLPGLEHNSSFEEDSVILTVRWPSVANDQVENNA